MAPKTDTQHPVRCLQRPTGEWFTFAPGNAVGKDTPDALDLCTEDQARAKLQDLGYPPAVVEQSLAWARKHAEISGDSLDLTTPTDAEPA